MLIRFINCNDESNDLLRRLFNDSTFENEMFISRQSGFKRNRFLMEFAHEDMTIYTDDEEILSYAEYDHKIKNFNVEIAFDDSLTFIPLKDFCPILRPVNDLVKMFHIGMIDEYYNNCKLYI